MENICGNKIRKLMTTNLYRDSVFQIYCVHWFWAVYKKAGSFRTNKINQGREEWAQV